MPLNDRKIISIIQDECRTAEERYKDYREDLFELVADIFTCERQHRVQGTNIQQKISYKCNAAARILTEKRGQTKRSDRDTL